MNGSRFFVSYSLEEQSQRGITKEQQARSPNKRLDVSVFPLEGGRKGAGPVKAPPGTVQTES